MSDSDSEGAFESADEEHEELKAKSVKQGTENKQKDQQQHDDPTPVDNSIVVVEQSAELCNANDEEIDNKTLDSSLPSSEEIEAAVIPNEILETSTETVPKVDSVLNPTVEEDYDNKNVANSTPADELPVDNSSSKETKSVLIDEENTKNKISEENSELQDLSERGRSLLDKLSASESKSSGWGWGSWGSAVINTATSSVGTFSSQVKHGLSTVVESVSVGLGAPSPEELAANENAQLNTEKLKTKDDQGTLDNETSESSSKPESPNDETDSKSGSHMLFGSLVSGVSSLTNVLEQTSSKVITGGLDTLELLGKKTMDMLQEGDPGLKKKRSLFVGEKPNLSQVLREAKEKAAEREEDEQKPVVNFSTIFDECQGLVHLEALEMLSKQYESKVKVALASLKGDNHELVEADLEDMNKMFENLDIDDSNVDDNSDHDFESLINSHITDLGVVVKLNKLFKARSECRLWLTDCKSDQDKGVAKDSNEIHDNAVKYLAEFTAGAIESIHNAVEMLLLTPSDGGVRIAETIVKFITVLCMEVSFLSARYSSCLTTAADDSEDPDSVTPLITSVYLEASNSSTYIQDALQLALPIVQFIHPLLN